MFEVFSQENLVQLVGTHDSPCITIYMPTHTAGRDRQQDEIRLSNLLRKVERQLEEQGFQNSKELLERISQLPDDEQLWRHRNEGLGIFASKDCFRTLTIPFRFPEFACVSDRFYITPLLPLLYSNGRYLILALTKNSADLYEATRFSIVEHAEPRIESDTDRKNRPSLQFSSQQRAPNPNGRREAPMYHGHGGPNEDEQTDISNFFKRQVEPVMSQVVQGQKIPLVLACVDYLDAIYREVNTYQYLVEGHVSGSPTEFGEEELMQRAWEHAAPLLGEVEQEARNQFHKLAGSNRISTEIEDIVQAAKRGQIETLFVSEELAMRPPSPGDQSGEAIAVPIVPPAEEATEQTLLFGGRVLAVEEVPGSAELAAVLRF